MKNFISLSNTTFSGCKWNSFCPCRFFLDRDKIPFSSGLNASSFVCTVLALNDLLHHRLHYYSACDFSNFFILASFCFLVKNLIFKFHLFFLIFWRIFSGNKIHFYKLFIRYILFIFFSNEMIYFVYFPINFA